jgi:hypothetical protein
MLKIADLIFLCEKDQQSNSQIEVSKEGFSESCASVFTENEVKLMHVECPNIEVASDTVKALVNNKLCTSVTLVPDQTNAKVTLMIKTVKYKCPQVI